MIGATEEEKCLHRCCFTGHRPEKLDASEEAVKAWLEEQIDQAIPCCVSWRRTRISPG